MGRKTGRAYSRNGVIYLSLEVPGITEKSIWGEEVRTKLTERTPLTVKNKKGRWRKLGNQFSTEARTKTKIRVALACRVDVIEPPSEHMFKRKRET